MQHSKNTKKIEQIEKIAYSEENIFDSITEVIKKFDIHSAFSRIDSIKRCGVLISISDITIYRTIYNSFIIQKRVR